MVVGDCPNGVAHFGVVGGLSNAQALMAAITITDFTPTESQLIAMIVQTDHHRSERFDLQYLDRYKALINEG